jgi:hypothetical protein
MTDITETDVSVLETKVYSEINLQNNTIKDTAGKRGFWIISLTIFSLIFIYKKSG